MLSWSFSFIPIVCYTVELSVYVAWGSLMCGVICNIENCRCAILRGKLVLLRITPQALFHVCTKQQWEQTQENSSFPSSRQAASENLLTVLLLNLFKRGHLTTNSSVWTKEESHRISLGCSFDKSRLRKRRCVDVGICVLAASFPSAPCPTLLPFSCWDSVGLFEKAASLLFGVSNTIQWPRSLSHWCAKS